MLIMRWQEGSRNNRLCIAHVVKAGVSGAEYISCPRDYPRANGGAAFSKDHNFGRQHTEGSQHRSYEIYPFPRPVTASFVLA